jgi:hypothetical protein
LDELRQELCETKAINKINADNSETIENETKNDSKRESFSSHNSHPNERNSFEMLRTIERTLPTESSDILKQKCRQMASKHEECLQLRSDLCFKLSLYLKCD